MGRRQQKIRSHVALCSDVLCPLCRGKPPEKATKHRFVGVNACTICNLQFTIQTFRAALRCYVTSTLVKGSCLDCV